MITAHIEATTIEQAWILSMKEIMERGRLYRKTGGERDGLLRRSLDFCTLEITRPETRPLIPLPKPGCIPPCQEKDVDEYLAQYLYNLDPPAEHEHYTYAQFLTQSVHNTAELYKKNGLYCQQAVMPVGDGQDLIYALEGQSIPCLRIIDTRIIQTQQGINELHYYVYFRAWNHFGALPLNLAGIQELKEIHAMIITDTCDKLVVPGPTVAMSKDLHINDIEWDAARAWLGC